MARFDRLCLRTFEFAAACLLTAGVGTGNAYADTVYKVRLRDGSIAFTDRPPADATVLEKQQYDFPPPAPPPAKAPTTPRSAPRAAAPRTDDPKEQKKPTVEAAQQALAEARARLEKGREIIAGDFVGTANPKIKRHSPAYEERVQALEKAVADAEKDLADAIKARDAGR
jgi:type IV secretory pathway VirB10-like protein